MIKKYLPKDSVLSEGMTSNEGRVLPPLLLWLFGVPAGLCLVLWLIFFRG